MQNFTDDGGFAAISIEPWRYNNQIRTTLQRHEGWHRGMHSERARFVIARGQDSTPVTRAAHADWFTAQRRPVAHFDRRVKAIHVEMNDRAGRRLDFHSPI